MVDSIVRLTPGKYRAVTPITLTLCESSLTGRGDPRQIEYSEFGAGEVFEVPTTGGARWWGIDGPSEDPLTGKKIPAQRVEPCNAN